MLVVGIDPGTATTGYGFVFETADGGLLDIDHGIIHTPADIPSAERLVIIYDTIQKLILLHRPVSGAVEKLFFQRNVSTAITVAQARGVALLALAHSGLPVSEYTPLEIKQAVTGYGTADKRQVQLMIKALLQLPEIPRPDDAADALAVAICHIHTRQYTQIGDSQVG